MNSTISDGPTHNIPFAVIKFMLGFLTFFLHTIVLVFIRSCTTITYSSRMFLISMYVFQIIYYLILTFYSPFVGMGVIKVEDKIVLKMISFIFLLPVYFLHLMSSFVAVDRLVAIQFSKSHVVIFTKKRTVVIICICVMYGIIFAAFSYTDCCFIVYNPTTQVWIYPYDKMNYRVISGSLSTYCNALLTAVVYIVLIKCLLKLR